jgi:superfamily II DNA or RNA helicase
VSVDPELLRPKAQVRLPGREEVVTLVAVTSGPFWEFFFEGPSGPGKHVLSESELDGVELVESLDHLRFDGDPVQFRLGVEARRIDIAFAYEMAAVAVSNIQPLPHQLEAVYDSFLREPRLRFLLADDPGAGKTIMAGLYMKELILRRAGDRILVVAPANLRPQWVRELAERFHLDFLQLGASHFDASLAENPWDHFDRVVVSRDFLRTDRAREAFEAADKEWDLAVIDEAHGYTISVDGKGHIRNKSERYKAAEAVACKSHRLVLMTATPHSGRHSSLWALLRLLDLDAWGDRCPKKIEIPKQQFRKVSKEIMRDMAGNKLFKDRHPHRVEYQIVGEEWELYEAVTDFVSEKLREIRGEHSKSAAGFALTTMQRRVASSTRAIRRTLERRVDRIDKGLEDPAAYLRNRRAFQAAILADGADLDELEDLDEEDRWSLEEAALEEWLPETVAELEAERAALGPLLALAQEVEARRTERKLTELLDVVHSQGLREDRRKQLLIFTEHKDTLDYLVENLSKDFEVATIHGQMRLADRIAQERYFRETAQIMVATEAAGEGINLQFCHLMVNYDIPWNPNRLEQRMGRIHRIGQTQDVHIFNLVATNTREGYVLNVLLKKMENMGVALGDKVFDVVGQAVGTNLRQVLEAVLAGEMTKEEAVETFGGEVVDPETKARAEELLQSALARHHLDWETERDRAARAEERRLPPSYFERFFVDAIAYAGGRVTKRLDPGSWAVNRSPDVLVARSRSSGALRQIAPEYKRLTFDKAVAARPRRDEEVDLPAAELCGPGHPLFDALVSYVIERTGPEVAKGSVFFDPDVVEPTVLRFLVGDVVDGNGEVVRRSLVAARVMADGRIEAAPAASLFDVVPPTDEIRLAPNRALPFAAPADDRLVMWARQHLFERVFQEARAEREGVAAIQEDFLKRSFNVLLANAEAATLTADEEVEKGVQGAEGRLRKAELVKEQHEQRRRRRLDDTERGRSVARGSVTVLGSALLLPLPVVEDPDGGRPSGRSSMSDPEIEHIAVAIARQYETERGATVRSVEAENVGFDLLSTRGSERRCIEVKGRAGLQLVELTWSEFAKSQELGDDYWLYVVLDCAQAAPRLYRVQDPAKALAGDWRPSLDVRYRVDPEPVMAAAEEAPA